ncbi:heme biosynthesis HemY N-terminal domain-containing protein [Ostreibacterium oceani]|uniref:Tetratricopeptide repeat protein n=1 Tax=Ostreibacterium oceani TaxID=2654998 RepID=A0A6N7EWE5_9GAMM|nr:heme biosynthesis HemY N-terminal domain-containing protein [Ostreibacterium oceani]MPV85870.1 tetratricopeptide repeat protein [Ostreibacterium oceani]
MRYAVILILSMVALVWLGTMLHDYQGYVTVTLPQGRYEMQLWYFALAVLVTVLAITLIVKVLALLIHLPRTLQRFSKNHKKLKANNLLQKGMQAMGKGHWRQAEKYLAKGAKVATASAQDPTLFWTNAAEAAQNQGADERRNQYLLAARQLAAEGIDTLSAALVEAELHLKQNHPQKAIDVLLTHHHSHYLNPKLISLEIKAYTQLGDYENTWLRLSHLKKHLPNKASYTDKQTEIATALFHSHETPLTAIEKAWHDLPKAVKQQDSMLLNYASALIHHGETDKAEKLLENAIKAEFPDPLIHAYTQIDNGSSRQKLKKIEKWLKYHPKNAYLNYGAAKFAFASDELEAAKVYAEQSLTEIALPEVLTLLGDIYDKLGETSHALSAYKNAARMTYGNEAKKSVSGVLLTGATNYLSDSSNSPNSPNSLNHDTGSDAGHDRGHVQGGNEDTAENPAENTDIDNIGDTNDKLAPKKTTF